MVRKPEKDGPKIRETLGYSMWGWNRESNAGKLQERCLARYSSLHCGDRKRFNK